MACQDYEDKEKYPEAIQSTRTAMSQPAYSWICRVADEAIAESKKTLLDMKSRGLKKKKDKATRSSITEKCDFFTRVYRVEGNDKKLFLVHYLKSTELISDEDMKMLTKNYAAVGSSSPSSIVG